MSNFESLVWKERREPYGVLTDSFVYRFDRYVNWPLLSRNYALDMPLDMIRTYQHRLIWATLLRYRQFSEDFLREMVFNFDVDSWEVLSKYQKLSESFIRDFPSNVDWDLIVEYQIVSGDFLSEFYEYYTPEEERMIVV